MSSSSSSFECFPCLSNAAGFFFLCLGVCLERVVLRQDYDHLVPPFHVPCTKTITIPINKSCSHVSCFSQQNGNVHFMTIKFICMVYGGHVGLRLPSTKKEITSDVQYLQSLP